ncbi:hypothetical protein BS47DRAFT_1363227 [Hydnum rufescens UP504]|uniref:Uncharacterized protein n=1 Tax=Hydnum rufescens UP504 TaxID=1448309 RepID=A0A9P6AUR9_9AGAM|nr:hypothetical protein BS47DRAFT_1363227 [Hydnum rufescens UP504]
MSHFTFTSAFLIIQGNYGSGTLCPMEGSQEEGLSLSEQYISPIQRLLLLKDLNTWIDPVIPSLHSRSHIMDCGWSRLQIPAYNDLLTYPLEELPMGTCYDVGWVQPYVRDAEYVIVCDDTLDIQVNQLPGSRLYTYGLGPYADHFRVPRDGASY